MPVRLVLQHNLRQLGAYSARSNPQHSLHNLLSVALSDLLTLLLKQGLMRLASNSSRPGLVCLVKHSLSSQPVASSAQVTLLSVKSPPPADSYEYLTSSLSFSLTLRKRHNHMCRWSLWSDAAPDNDCLWYYSPTTADRRIWHRRIRYQ